MNTPRRTPAQKVVSEISNPPLVRPRKERSLSLSRPSLLNLKFFHTSKPNSSASRKNQDASATRDRPSSGFRSVSNFPINELTPQSFQEFMKHHQAQVNSAAELQKSIKIIQNSYSYLNSENSNLQKEISNIQAEICELQKNNDLLRDFSLRLKLKTLSERERLDHNTRVLVHALNNLRALHANHAQRSCASCSYSRPTKEQSTPMSGDAPCAIQALSDNN